MINIIDDFNLDGYKIYSVQLKTREMNDLKKKNVYF